MNIQNKFNQDKLERLLDQLKLTPNNKQLAMDYLLAEVPEEALLQQMDPQSFRLLPVQARIETGNYLHPIREGRKLQMLARFYRVFWAIGKSTACFLLTPPFRSPEESRQDRLSFLGKAPVAAMDAEMVVHNNTKYMEAQHLEELARQEPEVLLEAQKHGGDPAEDWMRLAIAGFLLSCGALAPDDAQAQCQMVVSSILAEVPELLGRLHRADQQLLLDYIQAGDPTAPLPALSDPSIYATGISDFWQTHFTDDKFSGKIGTMAFMAQSHDPRARCIVRVLLGLNPRILLLYATQVVPRSYFQEQLPQLLEDLPGGKATMLLLLTGNYSWIEESFQVLLAQACVSALPQVLAIADPNQFSTLSRLLPGAVKALGVNVQAEVTRFLCQMMDSGEDALEDFLLGSGSLAEAEAQLKTVSYSGYHSIYKIARMVRDHRMMYGWDDFSLRTAVVLGTVFHGGSLRELLGDSRGTLVLEEIPRLCQALQAQGLSLTMHLDLLGNFKDNMYYDAGTNAILACVTSLLLPGNQVEALSHAAKQGNLFTRQQALRALNRDGSEQAKQGILACTGDTSKAVQKLMLELLPGHPDWAPDYMGLLKSKKAAERILAAQVLGKLGDVGIPALLQALETEKSTKVADAIQTALGDSAKPPVTGTEALVQQILNNNKLKKLQWLLETPLPTVRPLDGSPEDGNLLSAMLVVYSELGRIGRSDTAAQIALALDPGNLEAAADEVFERWIAAGAPAKHKWVLTFASVYGGQRVCDKLIRAIHDWPQNARGAIACDGVKALTLSTAPGALLAVDAMARKFKFRQVKVAAAAALDSAAQELGISVEELADRIVPDLGFDAEGKRIFDYGKRSFTVRLTPALELAITTDAGKPVKNLPAPGKTDDEPTATQSYEAFKAMKKQIRTTVSTQKARLESALATLRCWDSERWNALFVRNPIMHQFAISLIWGVYQDGVLTDTFRYMEDGSFNTVEEEEFELPEGAKIGLVHPVELGEDVLSGWKQQLEDYEITQSIQQLERPVYTLADDMTGSRVLESFGGKRLNGLSLSGKLIGLGWFRGSVVDGGAFYNYWREDPSLGLGVELRFSGSFVGDENDEVTVYDAVFYKAGTVTRGSYNYDAPKEENIFSLAQIPARYYSEIIYQLTKATASSTETDPDWRSDRKDQ